VVEHGGQALHETADAGSNAWPVTRPASIVRGSRARSRTDEQEGKALPPDQQSGLSARRRRLSPIHWRRLEERHGHVGRYLSAGSSSQPNLTAVKSDFVPGDKLIFYDDFTDMRGDEPPPHWKVRGGTAELRTAAMCAS